ncbi:helix-turn-helix domain-containing protein [Cohnella rhizosphaerae]|uniref:Helix-turn-helix domain-containing protein n=1 Tax=Cohnella rhizosphaerae TaxID=1457232 RepID=A0A9X4L6C3_9BACL|nr:helix-turn-helix domain-containing protein [Cohnella rhizosphaerae]MDG0814312.1 helix-turn-helix domain-containing protein [Cohnella rhizosphaerae]
MTFKLLIVDDFFVERETVKELISASDLELEVAGEACDGREALAFIEREAPDFVLTDIEMPFMNGIEFAEALRRRHPEVDLIFFTYYEKFEYAKKSDRFECVFIYIEADCRRGTGKRLAAHHRRQEAPPLRDRRARPAGASLAGQHAFAGGTLCAQLVRGAGRRRREDRGAAALFSLSVPAGPYAVLAVELDDPGARLDEAPVAERELLLLRVSDIVTRALADRPDCLICKAEDLRWGVCLFGSQEEADAAAASDRAFAAAERIWQEASDAGFSLTIGIGSPISGLDRLAEGYRQAAQALSHKFRLGHGQLISADEVEPGGEAAERGGRLSQGMLDEVNRALLSGEAERFADRLLADGGLRGAHAVRGQCLGIVSCVQLLLSERNLDLAHSGAAPELQWERLLKLETIADIRQWLIAFLDASARWMEAQCEHKSGAVVREAKRLMEARYDEPLTVKAISDSLHYSPNYLNFVFKQETGQTILEHLTHVRIKAAQKLLRETAAKMYEISRMVGYGQETYFRSVFKQITGLTPKEYREKTRGPGSL